MQTQAETLSDRGQRAERDAWLLGLTRLLSGAMRTFGDFLDAEFAAVSPRSLVKMFLSNVRGDFRTKQDDIATTPSQAAFFTVSTDLYFARGLCVKLRRVTPSLYKTHTERLLRACTHDTGAAVQVVVFSGPKMLDSVEEIKKDSNAYPVVTGPLARDETFAVFATTENDLRQRQVQVLHYWISTYSPFDPPIEPKVEDIMEEIPLILPEYEHLKKNVTDFVGDFAFHQSIFVMMKWEDKDMAARKKEILTDIFAGVSEAASPFGLTARRADRKTYHTQLWDNLCTYMIGCKYGIAILEDKVLPELNPNVTLELGFMRALGRHVLLFVEENFKHNRIDLLDTIPKKFTIDKKGKVNKESIRSEVQNWLQVDLKLTKKTY